MLITGAAGFIGSHLVERFHSRGFRVIGLDNFDPFYPRTTKERTVAHLRERCPGFVMVEGDITDAPALRRLFAEHRPETVVHMAAKAGVRPSIEDPAGYSHANVTGTACVLAEASRAGAARVVVASSSSVYGNCPSVPFAETMDVSEPVSPYAATKRACELIGYTHWTLTRTPVAMLRFFTVFGPRQRPDLAIAKFMARISRGEEIEQFGDGSMSRDFTFVGDVVDGVLAACERIDAHGYRVWNLGHNHPVALRDMIHAISRVVGREARVRTVERPPGDVDRTWADLSRAEKELGYRPRVSFEEGLKRQWEWLRAER